MYRTQKYRQQIVANQKKKKKQEDTKRNVTIHKSMKSIHYTIVRKVKSCNLFKDVMLIIEIATRAFDNKKGPKNKLMLNVASRFKIKIMKSHQDLFNL